MFLGIVYIMNDYAAFCKDLKLTSTDDILAASSIINGGKKISKEKKNLLRKEMRNIFSDSIEATVIPRGLSPQLRALVCQRRSQRSKEERMFKWFVAVYNKPLADVGSEKWDSDLEEAINLFSIKRKTLVLHRGSIYFTGCRAAWVWAFIYFFRLLFLTSLYLLRPNVKEYIIKNYWWCMVHFLLTYCLRKP